MFLDKETVIRYNEKKKNYKYDKYGKPRTGEILLSMFARKNLIQHGFLAGMRFAGLTNEKLSLLDEEGKKKLEREMLKALSDVFEMHGMTREIEF